MSCAAAGVACWETSSSLHCKTTQPHFTGFLTPLDGHPFLNPGSGVRQPPAALPAFLAIPPQLGLSHWPLNVYSLGGSVRTLSSLFLFSLDNLMDLTSLTVCDADCQLWIHSGPSCCRPASLNVLWLLRFYVSTVESLIFPPSLRPLAPLVLKL